MCKRLSVFACGVLAVVLPFTAHALYQTPNGYYAVASGLDSVIPAQSANPNFFTKINYATGGPLSPGRVGTRQIAVARSSVATLARLNPTVAALTTFYGLYNIYKGSNPTFNNQWLKDTVATGQTVGTCDFFNLSGGQGDTWGAPVSKPHCLILAEAHWNGVTAAGNPNRICAGPAVYSGNGLSCPRSPPGPQGQTGQSIGLWTQTATNQTSVLPVPATDFQLTPTTGTAPQELMDALGWPVVKTLPEIVQLEQELAEAEEATYDADPQTQPGPISGVETGEGVETAPQIELDCTGSPNEPCSVLIKETAIQDYEPPTDESPYTDKQSDFESLANTSPLSSLPSLPIIDGGACTPFTWNSPITATPMRFPSVAACAEIDNKVKPMLAFILYLVTAIFIIRAMTSRNESAV